MRYRELGNTGLRVSEVALGTVELGLNYGFTGSAHYQRPASAESIKLIRRAVELGINLIDTARAYGDSESLIGEALQGLSPRPYIATKVYLPDELLSGDFRKLRRTIVSSVETSLRALRIDTLDLIQIHNTKSETLHCEEVFAVLEELKGRGMIQLIGASCAARGEANASEIVRSGLVSVLQAPFNLLDQELARSVFPTAELAGKGILIRTAFLRGVLTNHLDSIPARLAPLRERALAAVRLLRVEVESLAEAALRFCLSFPAVSSVITGVRSIGELETNLAAAARGPLSTDMLKRLSEIDFKDKKLVDTAQWQDLTT